MPSPPCLAATAAATQKRQIAAEAGHTGALLPAHIRRAHRMLDEMGRLPHSAPRGRLFKP